MSYLGATANFLFGNAGSNLDAKSMPKGAQPEVSIVQHNIVELQEMIKAEAERIQKLQKADKRHELLCFGVGSSGVEDIRGLTSHMTK